jgi:hypothetical protein
MSREHTFTVRDSDAEMDGKPHAVIMTSADGARSHSWDLSDVELMALYRVVNDRINTAGVQYRAEVKSGRIRELSEVPPEEIGHHRRTAARDAGIWEAGGTQET